MDRLRARTVIYYIILMDDNIINPTIKLFDLLMELLPVWLGFSYDDLVDCKFVKKFKVPELARHLPEHLLESMNKFHMGVFRFKQNYLQMLGESHVH